MADVFMDRFEIEGAGLSVGLVWSVRLNFPWGLDGEI